MLKNKKFKISKKIGMALWGDDKDPSYKKNYPLNNHSYIGRRNTEFGDQLIKKQMFKAYYGYLKEKQFKKIVKKTMKIKGNVSENLVINLESRLDSFIYRANFVKSIFHAKQVISHKHILVNNEIVNVSSYILSPQDIIKVSCQPTSNYLFKNIPSVYQETRKVPSYIKYDPKLKTAILLRKPILSEIFYPVNMCPRKIIEFYSR